MEIYCIFVLRSFKLFRIQIFFYASRSLHMGMIMALHHFSVRIAFFLKPDLLINWTRLVLLYCLISSLQIVVSVSHSPRSLSTLFHLEMSIVLFLILNINVISVSIFSKAYTLLTYSVHGILQHSIFIALCLT